MPRASRRRVLVAIAILTTASVLAAATSVVRGRITDLVDGIASPDGNERLQFARRLVERRGINPKASDGKAQVRRFVVETMRRMVGEVDGYVRALQSADVVLYDDLVSPRVVEMARREAARINVGKRGYKPSCTQEDISALIVALAQEGKRVVRLKGGDPMIFGRANEEIAALRAAGLAVEIVPGVTSAGAAAAALQSSLTERDLARRVQFITAHGRDGHLPRDLDWAALADPRATSVVYMGVKTLAELSARLIAHGLPGDTPACMVERASWPDERVVRSTIALLPDVLAALRPQGPCLILIGLALATVSRSVQVPPGPGS